MSPLAYELCTTASGFRALEGEWRRLHARAATSTVFQSWEWNAAWIETHARDPFVVCMRRASGELAALVPLVQVRRLGYGTLRFIGAPDSDYLDFLVAEDDAPAAVACFLERVLPGERGVAHVELDAMPERSPVRALLERAAPGGFDVSTERRPCPYLVLPDSWERYLESLGRSRRATIRRKERALERAFRVEVDYARTPRELTRLLPVLFAQHQERWQRQGLPGAFARPRFRRFHEVVAPQLLAAGQLRLYHLDLDGVPAATYYMLADGGSLGFYLSGFSGASARYAPGAVLMGRLVRAAIEEGFAEFDFMRGSADYKFTWTSTVRHDTTFRFTRRTPGARAYVAGVELALAAKERLRRFAPRATGGP